MLALLRYLPLRWTATRADAARTVAGQVDAAVAPPAGRFTWRYPNTPGELTKLWYPGRFNILDRGAVMAFQKEHDLTVDGFAGHDVWKALIADVIAGRPRGGGYSYVFVHSSVPTSLNLWHDGRVILTSPGNTGVPAAPTKLGTFPVFEHIPVGTMSGTNPDGIALPRPRRALDQLLQPRRGDPRLQPGVVRHAAEPRLRRAATGGGGEGLAVHADRHARHRRGVEYVRRPRYAWHHRLT